MIPNQKYTILAVDDTPENLDILKGLLAEEYIFKAAINGEVAMKIAENQHVDLILLDVMMPGKDGYEVCREIKSNPKTKSIPVIFVTANKEQEDEAMGFRLGAVDYITKPVNPVILRARIRTHLAFYDQRRTLDIKVKERTEELNQTRLEVIQRLGRAAEYRDDDTGQHTIRVAKYTKVLARAYGLDESYSELISQASPMHDVGKIGISDNILLKPGKLTADEFHFVKKHSEIGSELLSGSEYPLMKTAQIIARHHHEKWDGTGYPDGLKGEEIPIEARIVAVSDVFDALSSSRPYKQAWPMEKIVTFFNEQSGLHFDPELVEVFHKVFPEFLKIREEYNH
ncbi:two-component system response regulator [Hydrogenovibrio sp. SC-1]|uniref:response regulator n=1 Tax=Hydrogenovibrio sp. SC-1 TaxID=2065820 RepID=UPI000C7992C4|nr:two-component system response regulator [Hydrogenovibrio sp. SC-1]PLA73456.1 two-component system response regulator [Hydrogenovibrio sp. SC-1]